MWDQSLGLEDPLEPEMTTLSSILAWENPMDRGVWQATVHEVAESRTLLKRLTQHTAHHLVYLLQQIKKMWMNLLAQIKKMLKTNFPNLLPANC